MIDFHYSVQSPLGSELESFYWLDQQMMPFPWSKEMWQGVVGDSSYILVFAGIDMIIAGFALFHLVDQTADLYKIAVDPAFLGKGVASALISFGHRELMARNARTVLLEVQKENVPAVKLYEKMGYEYQRAVRRYYSNGDDALIFSYVLDKT